MTKKRTKKPTKREMELEERIRNGLEELERLRGALKAEQTGRPKPPPHWTDHDSSPAAASYRPRVHPLPERKPEPARAQSHWEDADFQLKARVVDGRRMIALELQRGQCGEVYASVLPHELEVWLGYLVRRMLWEMAP